MISYLFSLIAIFVSVPLISYLLLNKSRKDIYIFFKKRKRFILSFILASMAMFTFSGSNFTYDILTDNNYGPFIIVYTGDIAPDVFEEIITGGNQTGSIESYLTQRNNIEGYYNDHYVIFMEIPQTVDSNIRKFIPRDNKVSIDFLDINIRFKKPPVQNSIADSSILAYEVKGKYKGQPICVNIHSLTENRSYKNSYIYKDGVTYKEVNNELHVIRYIGQQETVTIPKRIMDIPITKICEYTFYKNNTIKTLILPKTLKVIEDYPIYKCKALTQILVDDKSDYFTDYEGVLFTKNLNELVLYPPRAADETYIIPESVSVVRNSAFHEIHHLKHIVLHENIAQMPTRGSIGTINDYQISFSVKQGTYGETYVIENDYPYDYIE